MFHRAIHFILLFSLSLTAVGQMNYRCLDEEPVSRHVCCCEELQETEHAPCPMMDMSAQPPDDRCCEVDHQVVSSDGSPWVAAGSGPPPGGGDSDGAPPAPPAAITPTWQADFRTPLSFHAVPPVDGGTRTFLHTRRLRI